MAGTTQRPRAIPQALLSAVCLLMLPAQTWAIEFEVELRIRSEDDLHDLLSQGVISDETHQSLLDLLRSGLDLARANEHELYALPGLSQAAARAIVAHRRAQGGLPDPERLVHDGVLTTAQWEGIQPFIIQRLAPSATQAQPAIADTDTPSSLAPRAQLLFRGQTLWGDPVAPPGVLRGRLALGAHFTAGALLVGRRLEAGDARWSPSHQALFADGPAYRMSAPKFFAAWRTPRTRLLLGHFRIGFGERLTLDTTGLRTPDGAVPDDVAYGTGTSTRLCRYSTSGGARPVCAERGTAPRSVAADVRVPLGFRGAAGSVEGLPLGRTAVVNVHGFLSYVARPLYQYELRDLRACPSPYSDDARSRDCAAPPVFETGHPDRRLAYVTLQSAFTELAAGGNLAIERPGQARLSATGYYALPSWRIPGARVDFQEHSRYPAGGGFGALGLNAVRAFEALSLSAEIARSVDASRGPRGGGLGVVVRALAGGRHDETELSLRYFQRDFANPYARPVSAPDRVGGLSARDELGARLRLAHSLSGRARLRASADLWTFAPDGPDVPAALDGIRLHVLARADIEVRPRLPLSIWIEHGDRALGHNGPGLCYDQAANENLVAGTDPDSTVGSAGARCHGELYRIGARLAQSARGRRLHAALQLAQDLVSDVRYPRSYRRDLKAWGELGARVGRAAHLGARTSYSDGAIDDDRYLERAWLLVLEAAWTPAPGSVLRLRSSRLALLDRRSSTLSRTPNPEYAFTLELEHRF